MENRLKMEEDKWKIASGQGKGQAEAGGAWVWL